MQRFDVVIVGAGPAGLATALHLLRRRPQLAGRIAVLEKARHPRPKICAGGLIPKAIASLKDLGIALEIPAVEVFRGSARTIAKTIELRDDSMPLCTVVRRDRFDAALARAARAAGLQLFERTHVTRVAAIDGQIQIETDNGAFTAPMAVGADGSGSRVRSDLFGQRKANIGRALMADIPVDPSQTDEFLHREYRFDFRCIAKGIHGYAWSFPCLIDGRPHLNLGIYDQLPRDGAKNPLPHELIRAFPEVAWSRIPRSEIKAFPIRWHDPNENYARPDALLVGDAAGVDPLMGEGISVAFDQARLAAHAIVRRLEGDSAAFDFYDRALHESAIGRKLRRLSFAAKRFYGARHPLYFRLAGASKVAQQIGIDWYNGARGIDELAIGRVLARWAGDVLLHRELR